MLCSSFFSPVPPGLFSQSTVWTPSFPTCAMTWQHPEAVWHSREAMGLFTLGGQERPEQSDGHRPGERTWTVMNEGQGSTHWGEKERRVQVTEHLQIMIIRSGMSTLSAQDLNWRSDEIWFGFGRSKKEVSQQGDGQAYTRDREKTFWQ